MKFLINIVRVLTPSPWLLSAVEVLERVGMRLVFVYVFLFSLNTKAQVNLVPNYSFEDSLSCFHAMGVSGYGTPIYLQNWYGFNGTSPDYFNTCANNYAYPSKSTVPINCFGIQKPRTANAYVGIAIYDKTNSNDTLHMYAEYVAVQLQNSLKPNTCYYGAFYANLAEISGFASNQFGALLTQNIFTTSVGSHTNSIQPQIQWDSAQYFTDTANWVKISNYFIAQGGEQYLTIGNFKDGIITKKKASNNIYTIGSGACSPWSGSFAASYIYIDDVFLYELPNHTGTQSYTLCAGESLLLGDTVSLPVRYQWSLNGVVIDTTKNIKLVANEHFGSAQWPVASNSVTVVLQTKHCTTQTQTITITINDCAGTEALEVPNVFTPNGDGVNDVFEFSLPKNWTLSGAEVKSFSVYNRWGNNVASAPLSHQTTTITAVQWDGRTTAGILCSAGVYFYVLEYTNANGDVKKKNGYISLIN